MRAIKSAVVALTILITSSAMANDIVVSTASLTGQNTTAGANNIANFTFVRFNLAWSNSWRVSTGPSNWDAAWIFVKYRIEGGTGCTPGAWQHATISTTNIDHSITTDNGTAGAFEVTPDGKGVFIHRSGNGTGAINWQQIMLRWNYGTDGILDACNVSVKVFAVETVYVPQAAFYAGDGASNAGQFKNGASAAPLQITSEGGLTLGGGAAGSLGNSNRVGEAAPQDDWDNATSTALAAAFPKGFAAFYSMKYEISQEQYVEFLNTLTVTQQLARHPATLANRFWPNSATVVNRNGVKCVILPAGATPGTYACDLNANGTVNEAADGQNIAMQALNSQDLMAYLDWSGLRVMTELELEKAGRGTLPAVVNEYAWGSTTIYATTYSALINPGTGSELPNSPSATLGNALYAGTSVGIGGPMRVGAFATASSSRVTAGASYYGIMEFTGSTWELVVGVGHAAGRTYTGAHGNGVLTAAGFADVDFWPGANGNAASTTPNAAPNSGSSSFAGMMFRGGSFQEATWLRLSDRGYPGWNGLGGRDSRQGGRGVRTAP
ncbi:MAG TPA: SUMF1/EgtB/PvdO family nonheme iron enzyme [Cyclobacteriaceae bacterium]|nr:SUMF1/EgtB/PvdO family nonheme iron enzyme [Cyclobacteriaceae bacterium]